MSSRKKNNIFLLLIMAFVMVLVMPSAQAFAAGRPGGSGNGGNWPYGGSTGGYMRWYFYASPKNKVVIHGTPNSAYGVPGTWNVDSSWYGRRVSDGPPYSLVDYTSYQLSSDGKSHGTRMIAYVTCKYIEPSLRTINNDPWNGFIYDSDYKDDNNGCKWESPGNWIFGFHSTSGNWSYGGYETIYKNGDFGGAPTELTDPKLTGYPIKVDGNGIIRHANTNEFVSVIWIDPALEFIPKTEITYTTTMIRTRDSSGKTTNYNYSSQENLKKLFNNPVNWETYENKTDPEEKFNNFDVEGDMIVIRKTRTYKENSATGKIKDEVVKYDIVDRKHASKTIKYETKVNQNTQTLFKPFNLNTNNFVTAADKNAGIISEEYVKATKNLNLTANNMHDVKDNNFMESLDTNTDYSFKFKMNGSHFGMPDSGMGWKDTIPGLGADGKQEWEETNLSGPYANGKNVTDGDGYTRANLRFEAGITNCKNDNTKLSPTSELLYDNKNKSILGGNVQIFKTNPLKEDWVVRFTLADKYYTKSNGEGLMKNWWSIIYDQARFYEYGTHYKGYIGVNGHVQGSKTLPTNFDFRVFNPGEYGSSWGFITGGNINDLHTTGNPTITVNAVFGNGKTPDRGIYVGTDQKRFTQPVLYGKWDVRTIAGDIN